MSCETYPCVRTQYLVNADKPINFGDGLLYSETVLVKGIGKIKGMGNAGVQHRPPQPISGRNRDVPLVRWCSNRMSGRQLHETEHTTALVLPEALDEVG